MYSHELRKLSCHCTTFPYILLMFHWGIDTHVRGELHFSGNGDLLQMKRYELLAAQWIAYIGILGIQS